MEDDLLEEDGPPVKSDKFQCPKCGSTDVRRSSREGFGATLLAIVGRWPFRCRSCRGRFFRYAPPPPEA